MSLDVAEYRRLRAQLLTLRRAINRAWAHLEDVGIDCTGAETRIGLDDRSARIGRLLERAVALTDAPLGRLDATLDALAVDGACGHCARKERRR